jgi:hypothetical protein
MDKFEVFIVGPMGEDFARHTAAIKEGVERALKQASFPQEWEVTIPDSLAGANIVQDVFHKIDTADLAIADISNRSPNVFYEIALFDTLGTPTIILEKPGSKKQQPVPFYWRHTRVHQLKKFTPAEIAKKLEGIFENLASAQAPLDLTANPITQFYDVPLVDISAASGLAVGYYDNFLRHMLMEKQGALALPENKLDKLIVLRPTRVRGFQDDEDAIKQLFPNAQGITAVAPTHRRGKLFLDRVSDGTVIDIPTPIYSLQEAPRYKTLCRRLSHFHNLNEDICETVRQELEGKMIAAFFKTVEFLLRFDRGMSVSKLQIKTIAQLKALRT